MTRPSWDQYFMSIVEVVATRSNCLRPKKGAILVRGKQIISTGYNGTPRGVQNCDEGGCERCLGAHNGTIASGQRLDECTCCHAEENAITQAALHGTKTGCATMYTAFFPCLSCTKLLINAGITKVVFQNDYPSPLGRALLAQAGVELMHLPKDDSVTV